MEFVKVEIDGTSDPEPCRFKHEVTEKQTYWSLFLI